MPLYEYVCDACGHRFEVIQKFSDTPIEKCPVCGGAVHKVQSAPAFQFRGSGWYVTDYAKRTGDTKDTKETTDTKDAKETKETKETKEKADTPAAAKESTPTKSTEKKSTGA